MIRALAICLLVSGCGWPDDAACLATPSIDHCKATAPQVAGPDATVLPTVLIEGDSIAEQWATVGAGHWPAGLTTNWGAGGRSACAYPWIIREGWMWFGYVFIHLGTNDYGHGYSAATTWGCLRNIYDVLSHSWPRARVVLSLPLPAGNALYNCALRNVFLAELRAEIVASGYPYIDSATPMTCDEPPCGMSLCAAYSDDGLHPNAAGYTAWAAALGL
jgi:hypothetical protein